MNRLIGVAELRRVRAEGAQLVDVRSASEFASGHIPGATNIPMDQVEARVDDLRSDGSIVLICQAGTRARITAGLLEPCGRDIAVFDGGTNAWIQAGLPLVVSVKTRWSLERQVRLGAGLLILTGSVLAWAIHPYWLFLVAFVGSGLTFAGLTDICPMAILLGKMPWNRQSHCRLGNQPQDSKQELPVTGQ